MSEAMPSPHSMRQHMAAVDDDAATVAKRLQGVQQRRAARRIGELPRSGRRGADPDEGRREGERRGGGDGGAAIERRPARTRPPASALRTSSARSSAMAPLASTATPRKSGLERAHDRARADGRHVDAHLLARLGALDQHAAAAADAALGQATLQGEPRQHGVGVLGALDGLDAARR